MSSPTPAHLKTTLELVDRAYPQGVPPEEYLPLLLVLSDHMCEENLALAAAHWSDANGSRLNDVLAAIHQKPDASLVLQKLKIAGLEEWIAEE
jgi:hypothetical protein